jgi:hypothetical protein
MYLRLACIGKSARLLMQNEFELNPDWSVLSGFNDSQAKVG